MSPSRFRPWPPPPAAERDGPRPPAHTRLALVSQDAQVLGPYVELTRADWAGLAESTALPLDAATLERLRGLSDPTSLVDVREVYLPLTALLSRYVRFTGQLHRSTNDFLGLATGRTPFVI